MRTVSDLIWLAGANAFPGLTPKPGSPDKPANDHSTFSDIGARIGEDNETLRNLLIDTSHQFGAIDDLKASFSKLVEPLNNLLNTVENERADIASSQGALAAIRSSHETLRAEFQELQKQSSDLKSDNERLGRDLESSLQKTRELEADKARLGTELAAERIAMAVLVKQLGEEANNVRSLREEKGLLAERADTSDKRAVGLEAKVAHARERLLLLENDKETLQAALDKTLAELSRISRQFAESESALTATRSRLQQTESSLAVTEAERRKLSAACDEATERRQSEVYALGLKLDAAHSRSDAAEKLLTEVRQNLVARTEEVRTIEAKLLEVTVARNDAEKKVENLSVAGESRDQETKRLEQAGANLTERCKALTETLAATESSLGHAQEKIKSLAGDVARLQSDAAASRAQAEEDMMQLNATIEHERCERALAEGALETTRNDYAQLQRQMAQERSTRRIDHQRRMAGTNLTTSS